MLSGGVSLKALLVLLVVAGQCQGARELGEELATALMNNVSRLHGQATEGPRSQFATLILLRYRDVANIGGFRFQGIQGGQVVDLDQLTNRAVSSYPDQPVNYIVARPDRNQNLHAEEILIRRGEDLYTSFTQRYGPPAMAILFSRLFPCNSRTPGETHQCAEQIMDFFQHSSLPLPVIMYEEDPERIQPSFFILMEFARRLGDMPLGLDFRGCFEGDRSELAGSGCGVSHTPVFQHCLLQCLPSYYFTCIRSDKADETKAYFVNELLKECFLSENGLEMCFARQLSDHLDESCAYLRKGMFITDTMGCVRQCWNNGTVVISVPRNSAAEYGNRAKLEVMTDPSILSEFRPLAGEVCSDVRRSGFLCSGNNVKYMTAGNSFCRVNHTCGYYGKTYMWCFTTYSDHWDYCCTGPCYEKVIFVGSSCSSGSTYARCGGGGTRSKTGTLCLSDFPCGHHHDIASRVFMLYSHWCYIDFNMNWDYCK